LWLFRRRNNHVLVMTLFSHVQSNERPRRKD
jgi:hypothetical protein